MIEMTLYFYMVKIVYVLCKAKVSLIEEKVMNYKTPFQITAELFKTKNKEVKSAIEKKISAPKLISKLKG